MQKKWMVWAMLAGALAVPVLARAHEGHVHKVMGTVSMHYQDHLEVKATDGTTATIVLNDKTKVLRGKTRVALDDLKTGERVVVTATETKGKNGKSMMIATEIRLAASK
jgi:hypothetical protein